MTYGTDESRYQPYDGLVERIEGGFYSFVLLNVDDPGFVDKATLCESRRYVWGVYVYMLPGTSTDYDVDRVIAKAAPIGNARGGFWFDYEEPGVEPWQLARGFQRVDDLGVADRWGYYASNGALDHDPFLARRYWLAQYPPNNDGSFPGFVYLASRPIDLWQYTSGANDPSGVGLDRNVVIDEAWWAAFTGSSTGSGGTKMPDVYKLSSAGPTVPGLDEGSEWVDAGTRFLRAADVAIPAGTPRWGIGGADFETLRADKIKILAGTGSSGDATVDVDAVVAAALAASGAGHAAEEPAIEAAIRAALA